MDARLVRDQDPAGSIPVAPTHGARSHLVMVIGCEPIQAGSIPVGHPTPFEETNAS